MEWGYSSMEAHALSHQQMMAARAALAQVNEEQIIHMSRAELQRITRLSHQQLSEFLLEISKPLCNNIVYNTGLELWQDSTSKLRLSFGCPVLDKCCGGGLLLRGLTEVVGESASGKTQLCLQLALQVQLPIQSGGLGGKACYIGTEDVFPFKRLRQMAHSFVRKNYPEEDETTAVELVCNGVFVEQADTLEALWEVLDQRVPRLVQAGVKLLLIDSMAALVRFEYGPEEAPQRAALLHRHASRLKTLTDSLDMAVVVINQVSDLFADAPIDAPLIPAPTPSASKGAKIAALGLAWSNCINTRIMLERTHRTVRIPLQPLPVTDHPTKKLKHTAQETNLRRMHILLASHLPNDSCCFIVDTDGVRGIQDPDALQE